MNLKTLNATPLVFAIVIASLLSMLAATTTSITQTAIAQNQSAGQSTGNAPLNFYLKLNNNQSTSEAASQAASNSTGTKNMTITVSVQKGSSGNPIKLPISAVVPNNTNEQDLQLCASLSSGQQMCQPLGQNAANIDLSSSANSTAKTTPQSYLSKGENILDVSSNSLIQYAEAQLISVNNTTLNIPITVIVPITVEIQNAQICATVASSGGQSCQQIVLNPTQTAYTPVNVDLSNPTTPTVTTLSAAVPTTQQLTGSPTGTNDTSSGSTGTNTTSGSDTQSGANNTSDQSSSDQSSSDQSSTTQSNPTTTEPTQDNTDTKDKKNQDKKDNTDNSNNGNSGN